MLADFQMTNHNEISLSSESDHWKSSSSPPVTLDSLSKTMMTMIAAQVELEKQTNTRLGALESKFESMEAKMESKFAAMMEVLQKGEAHRSGKEVWSDDNPNIATRPHQVRFSNAEPGRSSRTLENSLGSTIMANRDSLLKKIEMPVFEGIDPYGWIVRV